MSCTSNLPPTDLTQITATTILSGEHRVILQVLACLERIAARAETTGTIPLRHAEQALEVIATFADQCHHGKEEQLLFPALERIAPGFGPTAVMREEHVLGRALVKAMREALPRGDAAAFASNARDFIALLTQHIAKEDDILFRMAAQMLSREEDEELVEAYRRIEHEDVGSGEHERLLGIADSLALQYGIPRASADPVIFALLTAVCGCHTKKKKVTV